jgi:hypothetical protein
MERLDDRLLPSASTMASAIDNWPGSTHFYAIDRAGQVHESVVDPQGNLTTVNKVIDSNVLSIAAGHADNGDVALYEIKTDHSLVMFDEAQVGWHWAYYNHQWHSYYDNGFRNLDTNILQVAASAQDGTYWEIKNTNGGQLLEHAANHAGTYTIDWGGITGISAGTDLYGRDCVYEIYQTGYATQLWQYDDLTPGVDNGGNWTYLQEGPIVDVKGSAYGTYYVEYWFFFSSVKEFTAATPGGVSLDTGGDNNAQFQSISAGFLDGGNDGAGQTQVVYGLLTDGNLVRGNGQSGMSIIDSGDTNVQGGWFGTFAVVSGGEFYVNNGHGGWYAIAGGF